MADRRLQVFHAVAKHLSFTRAADALFMSQPSVTFQVKQLEEEHNTRLFDRRHGQVSLTPAGSLLLEYAEKILAISDEMETRIGELSGEMRGLFMVGASTTLAESLMPELLSQFCAMHPQVRPRLFVANTGTIEARVVEHELEVGLIANGNDLSGAVYETCGEDELHVVCAPDHPLSSLKKLAAADLLEYEYLSREPGSGSRQAFEQYLHKQKIDPSSLKMLMELGSPSALSTVTASGLGFSVLSRFVLDTALRRTDLRAIPFKPVLKRNLHVVYPEGRFRSRMTLAFIEFVKNKTKEWAA